MFQKSTLSNGLRVITEKIEGTQSATVLVLTKAGSRWEHPEINGIAHFLEHMFFKGAQRYPNAKAVSEAIDGVGGEFNAFTSKEYAGYYVKLAASHVELAIDVISDMLLSSKFDDAEIAKERGVIMEEFNMYQDTPMYQVAWDFERAMFGHQPLGWDEVGTKEVIMRLSRDEFVDFKESLYVPRNMVVSVAGAVEHEAVVALVERFFKMEDRPASREMKPYDASLGGKDRLRATVKKTEQTHLVLGMPGLPALHKDYYAAKVLAAVLGGNMSSRMFLNVREEKGLCYYISTGLEDYLDAGTFYTRAGVNVNQVEQAVKAIQEEYARAAEEGIPEAEIRKGKEFLKGKLTLALEDSEQVAQTLALKELLYENPETYAEVAAQIDAVTSADVARLARELLSRPQTLAIIGPVDEAKLRELGF